MVEEEPHESQKDSPVGGGVGGMAVIEFSHGGEDPGH